MGAGKGPRSGEGLQNVQLTTINVGGNDAKQEEEEDEKWPFTELICGGLLPCKFYTH